MVREDTGRTGEEEPGWGTRLGRVLRSLSSGLSGRWREGTRWRPKPGRRQGKRRFYSLENFWPHVLLRSVPTFLPSPTPPTHSQEASQSSVTGCKSPSCYFSPVDVDKQAHSSPCPGRWRLRSVSPASLSWGQQPPPPRHSSGPNYTLHHFPTEADMGTDRSPSSGSDLHRPFHLHPAPDSPETKFSFIWSVLSVPQQSQVQPSETRGRERWALATQEGNEKGFTHSGSFLEDLGT